jgi:predicted restriction endonuclease
MCLRKFLPVCQLHSCTLQKFQISISQNSYISVSEYLSLLAKQPSHERRTVHTAPALVQAEADLCSLYTCLEISFWDKQRRAPFKVT